MTLKARDIMSKNIVTVTPNTPISEAADILLKNGFNGLPVVNEQGELKGIICQSDLISLQKEIEIPTFFFIFDGFIPLQAPWKLEKELEKMSAAIVGEAMNTEVKTIPPETDFHEIAGIMFNKNFHTLPVIENDKLIGIVGKRDMLKNMLKKE